MTQLPRLPGLAACLQVDPQWVQFELPAQQAPLEIDMPRFLAAVRSTDAAAWRAAAALHRAPLLDGTPTGPGQAYARWLATARDRLHALAMQQAAQGDLCAALGCLRRAIETDRAIGYAHALGHDLVDLAQLQLLGGERAEARVAMQEALVWCGFTEDSEALAATRARLESLTSDNGLRALPQAWLGGIKSHLCLGEGQVDCAFEPPVNGR